LTPVHAKQLIEKGHRVTVEKSSMRCVPDKDYEEAGCTLVDEGTWADAPEDAIILGLKELPESSAPLHHHHIYFAHCYKNQAGWQKLLKRFIDGNGSLLDIEYLVDDVGRRVAAFGRSAGFIGMAVGIKNWCSQQLRGEVLGKLDYYPNSEALIAEVKIELSEVFKVKQRKPSVLVMGALGRSGRGAIAFAEQVGVTDIIKWDIEETRGGGPFPQILHADIFVNCILLTQVIPPFITKEMLFQSERKLGVIVDVSCDISNPHNPVPVCNQCTDFDAPCLRIVQGTNPVDTISIDHLPSLVPLESSTEFSSAFLQHLMECCQTPVWSRAQNLFKEKSSLAMQSLAS